MMISLWLFCGLLTVFVESRDPDYQFYVPTRDGYDLNTILWYPDSSIFGDGPFPTILEQTPYGCSADVYYLWGTSLGYNYMCQDVRGQHGSNGTFSFFRTTGNDTMDTIEYKIINVL